MSQMHSGGDRLQFDLTDRLHKALRIGGHSATSLAVALEVHRNTVNNYLSGRTAIDRRTIIAWAFACGVPVQTLMRHESLATTALYTAVDEDEQTRAIRALVA